MPTRLLRSARNDKSCFSNQTEPLPKSVADQLKAWKDSGLGQHVEKIRSNAILMKVHGEELLSLQRIDDGVPLYVLELLGLELDGLDPNEGYLIFARIDRDTDKILKVSPYTRFFS